MNTHIHADAEKLDAFMNSLNNGVYTCIHTHIYDYVRPPTYIHTYTQMPKNSTRS